MVLINFDFLKDKIGHNTSINFATNLDFKKSKLFDVFDFLKVETMNPI